MTWRRFTTLLRGLGPNSATATRMHINRAEGRRRDKVVNIETPENAERAFVSMFGPPPSGEHQN